MERDADVRPATAADLPELVDDLWLPLARKMAAVDEYNALADDAREHALGYRRERIDEEGTATFLAAADGLAGFVDARRTDPPPVFERGPETTVSSLYVVPDRRRDGIAGTLLDRAAEWARERDCERLSLSVHPDNEAARRFYEKYGFRDLRRRLVTDL